MLLLGEEGLLMLFCLSYMRKMELDFNELKKAL